MEKKLPKVFANRIDKELKNNNKVYYSKEDKIKEETKNLKVNNTRKKGVPDLGNKNLNQKINAIFNSPNYIYKADVDIKLKTGKVSKKIIGRNSSHLITIDNELIPISDIVDIEYAK